jgi:hypothetical protein
MIKVDETIDLTNQTYTYEVKEEDDQVPALFIGIKVGIGF